ncbi:tautomerase family protein, partial [Aspergillus saccharolyticus JOP 1030-1]
MPLWQIYSPPGTFTSTTKSTFVTDITKFYTSIGLPAFYVVVQFHELSPEDVFVGGQATTTSTKPFVRVVITHIAIHSPDNDDAYRRTTARLDQVLNKHVLERGFGLEYHVEETERRLWKIDGMIPPPWRSEEEKLWVRENRAVEYEGAY